ncbi:hypothetical protein I551_0201 [Mycobacterium ulcerans str. Harvey]|uniref:Uncharacterized protein n=1 Tax=Mycobacterium ulcerans str. Harvey TaxID=1299332 RepID=A0ABP3AQG6_MYCUL|nr:hypothetical protein I551_0201 [Mycobacterium ulcerans str. Harvey]
MNTAEMALPDILDPMYWLGADGIFGSAVLPGILLIVFIETGLLFPLLPGESLLFTGGLLAASAHPPVTIGVLARPWLWWRSWATRPHISSGAGSDPRCSRRKIRGSSRSTM